MSMAQYRIDVTIFVNLACSLALFAFPAFHSDRFRMLEVVRDYVLKHLVVDCLIDYY